MRCPLCVSAGARHTLRIGNPQPTNRYEVTEFWDEADRFHQHDNQERQAHYHCSNNHNFVVTYLSRCPFLKCEWNQKPEIRGVGWPEPPKEGECPSTSG